MLEMIAAIGSNYVIGNNGDLPGWQRRQKADMSRFRGLTINQRVVLGRKTWESLPDNYRPLPDRENFVQTRNPNYQAIGAELVSSTEEVLNRFHQGTNLTTFIIGGGELYKEYLPFVGRVHLTVIEEEFEGDTFFPFEEMVNEFIVADEQVFPADERNLYPYRFLTLEALTEQGRYQ